MENRLNGHVKAGTNFNLTETTALPPKGPELWVHRMEKEERLQVSVFSKTWWGCLIHIGPPLKKSIPHTEPSDECKGCQKKVSPRWKFYLHCFDHGRRRQIFLELTKNAAEQLEEAVGTGNNFRGLILTIVRGATKNSRLKLTVSESRVPDDQMPPEKDPKPSLINMWGFPEQEDLKPGFPFREMFREE